MSCRAFAIYAVLLTAGTLARSASLGAQAPVVQLADRGPLFYMSGAAGAAHVDVRTTSVFRKRVSIHLDRVPLSQALAEVARQAGLSFGYPEGGAKDTTLVSLDANGITVASALNELLLDSGLDVSIGASDFVGLVPHVVSPAISRSKAQTAGAVAGRVTDSRTGAPIAYATVVLEGTKYGATTSDSGTYRIVNVAPGAYTVIGRTLGYVPGAKSVTVAGDQTGTVDFALVKSPNQLQQVVTTGTLTPSEVKAVPTPITVITDSEITQQQPRTVDEIFRQNTPTAVAFDQFANPSSTSRSVRGTVDLSGGTSVKTLIDGVEVSSNVTMPIDPESIDRIEVVRGPEAAAIYGSGAIDGVIQIFTKHGDGTNGRPSIDAQAAAANVQTPYAGFRNVLKQTYSADVRGGTSDASYTVGGDYSRTNSYLPFGAFSAQTTPSAYSGIHYGTGITTLDVSALYHVVNAPAALNPELKETEPPGGQFSIPPYTSDAYGNTTIGATLGLHPIPAWHNAFTIGYDELTFNEVQRKPHLSTPADTTLSFTYEGFNKISLKDLSALTAHLTPAVSGTLIIGADYWSENNVQTGSGAIYNVTGVLQTQAPFSDSRYVTQNTGVFAQTQIDFWDALFITAGVRADWNSDFGDSISAPLSPRVGIAYSHSFGLLTAKIRASYGSAILPPSSGDKTLIVQATQIQLANPSLGPERQNGGDGGVDLLFGNAGSFSATYFNQRAINSIEQVNLPSDSIPTSQNQTVGNVSNRGIELEGRVGIGPVALRANYGYTRSRVDKLAPGYTGDYHVGDQTFVVPKNTGGASLSLRVSRGTSITAGLTYVGSWTAYDEIKEFACLGGLGTGDLSACPPAFVAGLANGQLLTRSFLIPYPSLVKGSLGVTQRLSRWASAFVSIENIGDNENYEATNIIPRVGRISTVGLRVHY